MKKVNIILSITIICLFTLIISGWKKNNEESVTNQKVGAIKYFVPNDYLYRKDLKGLFYSEDNRKIFAKGDTNDYNTFYYIDMIKSDSNGKQLSDYISDVNTKNLKDSDVKFKKINNENVEVHGREGYITKQGTIELINYAYITQVDDSFYTLTISGPKSNQKEIEELAKKISTSMTK